MNNNVLSEIDYLSLDDPKMNSHTILHKWFYHKEFPQFKLREKDFSVLSKSIETVLYTEFPKLVDFNYYLKDVANICYKLNMPITWTLPSGLKVNQSYVDSHNIRIKPFIHRKNSISLKFPNLKQLNKNKQFRALMPNLIHSLDAASLALLVNYFNSTILK